MSFPFEEYNMTTVGNLVPINFKHFCRGIKGELSKTRNQSWVWICIGIGIEKKINSLGLVNSKIAIG